MKDRCIVCSQILSDSWLKKCKDFYLRTPYVVDFYVCRKCLLVQQVPVPFDNHLFYPDSYPMHSSRNKIYTLARKVIIRRVYYKPSLNKTNSILFDFGCGDGSYLQSIRKKVSRIIGFETSYELAQRCQEKLGCNVYSCLNKASSALRNCVDIITAHFVLEHTTDLHETFSFWNHILKKGGILHIAVPNIRSLEAKLFRNYWHGLDPPRHISFPDTKSISYLSEIHGFKITNSWYGIFPNTLAGSLTAILTGRYIHALFLAFIPISFFLSCLFPNATAVYQLQKIT